MLMCLPFLEELFLRTLVAVTGQTRPKETVVRGWANGTTSNAGRHPNLYHISILQYTPSVDAQSLSHWFRRQGGWERVSGMVVAPTHSFVL